MKQGGRCAAALVSNNGSELSHALKAFESLHMPGRLGKEAGAEEGFTLRHDLVVLESALVAAGAGFLAFLQGFKGGARTSEVCGGLDGVRKGSPDAGVSAGLASHGADVVLEEFDGLGVVPAEVAKLGGDWLIGIFPDCLVVGFHGGAFAAEELVTDVDAVFVGVHMEWC